MHRILILILFFKPSKYDLCINCSGAASVPDSLKNPLRDYYLNTVNVFKILEAIRKFQPDCKFINLSSAAVYGNPNIYLLKKMPYQIRFLPMEFINFRLNKSVKSFMISIIFRHAHYRIFSVYGIGLKKQLFWDLYNKAKTGIPFICLEQVMNPEILFICLTW